MRLFKVTVRCYYERGKRLKCCNMVALVEADTGSDALDVGRAHVESAAPPNVIWREFTAMEAASVQLPRLVADI